MRRSDAIDKLDQFHGLLDLGLTLLLRIDKEVKRIAKAVLRGRVGLDGLFQLRTVIREVVDLRAGQGSVPVWRRQRVDLHELLKTRGECPCVAVDMGWLGLALTRLLARVVRELGKLGENLVRDGGGVQAHLPGSHGFLHGNETGRG